MLHASLYCLSKAKPIKLLLHIFLFLALLKGQAAFCLEISKWIRQCMSACYHMADKLLLLVVKLSALKHRPHPLGA